MRPAAIIIACAILILIGSARGWAAVMLLRGSPLFAFGVPASIRAGAGVPQLVLCVVAVAGGVGLLLGRRRSVILAVVFVIAFPIDGMINGWLLLGRVQMPDVLLNLGLSALVAGLLVVSRLGSSRKVGGEVPSPPNPPSIS
jgi:hypothetical protein